MVIEAGRGSATNRKGLPVMTTKLAAKYDLALLRLGAAARRRAEEGMATAEWALVTLCVCAFVILALGVLGTVGKDAIGKIVTEAFSKRP